MCTIISMKVICPVVCFAVRHSALLCYVLLLIFKPILYMLSLISMSGERCIPLKEIYIFIYMPQSQFSKQGCNIGAMASLTYIGR